jgi:hypothetical protein
LKSGVSMMIGFVDLMHKRRALLGTHALRTVASGAMGGELGLSHLQLRRECPSTGGGFWLGRVARDNRGKRKRTCQHRQPRGDRGSPQCPSPCRRGWSNCSRSICCVR